MKKKNGFTLVEILVVLGIIGLLMVFLIPNVFMSKDRAKETAVKAVMHSVQLAIEAYNMENETYPMGRNLTLRNLCDNYLLIGNYLPDVPKNPFTGEKYAESDVAGKVIYDYNNVEGKYTLIGYKRNGTSKLLELNNM